MELNEKILILLRQVTKKDVSPADDESLFDSGILDSFALENMVAAIEAEFGLSIPDSDVRPQRFETLAKIRSDIESRS